MLLILPGCGKKSKYNAVIGDMGKLLTDLQEREKTMDDYLQKRKKPEGTCSAAVQLDQLKAREKNIHDALVALKPKDMPTKKETSQSHLDPTTKLPVLETTEVVDWGKVAGNEQKIWGNLNTAELSLATAAGMLGVGCQCIDGNDDKSIQCTLVGFQFDNGRFSLNLDSVQSIYLKTSKELIGQL
jgi:hypothetical protein